MKLGLFSDASYALKFLSTLAVISISLVAFSFIGILIAIPLFNVSLPEVMVMMSDITNPENIGFLKYFQMIQSIGLFIIPSFLLGYLFYSDSFKYLSLNVKPGFFSIIISALLMFSAIPFINFLAEINSYLSFPDFMHSIELKMKEMEEIANETTKAFLNVSSIGGLFANIFIIAVIPALGEELLFRGVIQRIFVNWTKNVHIGIIITAILFSAMHMQFYGFLPRMLLGGLFGYLLVWSGSIWLPITAHFVNNATAVIFSYIANKTIVSQDIEHIGSGTETIAYTLTSIVVVSLLLLALYKRERNLK